MYRIRFHGRGGQGMKTSGRILGTAFFLEGYEVQDAPRYGAERRGAPIFAYVRASRGPIRERGVISQPDLVVVADETLLAMPAAGVLFGTGHKTVMVLCTAESSDTWKERLQFPGSLLALASSSEREGPLEHRTASAVCAGAAARVVGVISRSSLLEAISLELGGLGAKVLDSSRQAALNSYDSMTAYEKVVTEAEEVQPEGWSKPHWIDLPFEDARISAPVIRGASTSTLVKTGLWRTMRPVIDLEHCNRCWWVCGTFCPDGAIRVGEEGFPQVDYDHCKGCMICVAQCPSHAVRAVAEHESRSAADQGGVS